MAQVSSRHWLQGLFWEMLESKYSLFVCVEAVVFSKTSTGRLREGQRGRSHTQEGGEVPHLLRMELIFHPFIFADGCKLSNPLSSFNSLHLSHLSGCIRHLPRRRRWDASSAHSALRAVCQRCHGRSSGNSARTSCHLEMFWCLLTEYLWTKCGFAPPALGIPSHGRRFSLLISQRRCMFGWIHESFSYEMPEKCEQDWKFYCLTLICALFHLMRVHKLKNPAVGQLFLGY